MKSSQRLGRWALVLLLAGTIEGFGLVAPAPRRFGARDGSTEAGDCVMSYVSRGRANVAGPVYGDPYRSVGRAPYVEVEINSRPNNFSFASKAYEGWIGDIVLGTSDLYPRNSARWWPALARRCPTPRTAAPPAPSPTSGSAPSLTRSAPNRLLMAAVGAGWFFNVVRAPASAEMFR